MNAYTPATRSRLVNAAQISAMFGKPADWFSRDRTRKRLNAKGFPQCVERGLWLRTAIESWMERIGTQPATPVGREVTHGR